MLGKCVVSGTGHPWRRFIIDPLVWCVGVYSICMTGTLIALCKIGNSGSIH